MQVVSVAFDSGPKLYDYYTDLPLHVGDLVVVPARSSAYAVVCVRRVKEKSDKATKLVIQRVDIEEYRERIRKVKEHARAVHRP